MNDNKNRDKDNKEKKKQEPMTREEFVKTDGDLCPFCRSSAVDYDEYEYCNRLQMRAYCFRCKKRWIIVYRVYDYETIPTR